MPLLLFKFHFFSSAAFGIIGNQANMDIIINFVEVLERAKSHPKKVTAVLPDGVTMRDAPPLKVWVYSVGTAFSLLFLFLFYSYSEYGPLAKTLELGKNNLQAALIANNTGRHCSNLGCYPWIIFT